ncbi:MAG TPA: ATP-dependent Clp protease proteolytic subunit [Candidatus Paceibacterota bacterium]|nr:ATP-dependent Clp protease proteolytic subunit [Candidatus Paceibacterota bacterium]
MLDKIALKRTILVFGEIVPQTYCDIRDQLMKLASESSDPITILLDSNGGNYLCAIQLGDIIRHLPLVTIGIAIDAVSSALVILQYCTKRLIMPSGRVLIHSVRIEAKNLSDDEHFEKRVEGFKKLHHSHTRRMIDLFHDRTGLSEERIRELIKRGDDLLYHIPSAEALELNMVDGIVPEDYKLLIPPPPEKKEESPSNGKDEI